MFTRNVVVLLLSLQFGCTSFLPTPPDIGPGEVLVPNSEYASGPFYRVWYATNRRPFDRANESKGYSNDSDNMLHYGTCIVHVPESHCFGSVGSSWIYRVLMRRDDPLTLEAIDPIPGSESFFHQMQGKLSTRPTGGRTVLVYIHGYNTSFEEAAIRAAQIGYDLKIEGVTALFSWPSKNETYQYFADKATIEASELTLAEFLQGILDWSGAEQVNVIAHSMGNQGLLRTLDRMHAKGVFGQNKPFGQIILAAPDVDQRTFANLASVYPKVSVRTTLYVSSKDMALRSSGIVQDYPRAGFMPPVTTVPGIDTIEVTKVDLTLLGHTYFAEAEPLLRDIHDLLTTNASPDRRLRIKRTRGHWRIR